MLLIINSLVTKYGIVTDDFVRNMKRKCFIDYNIFKIQNVMLKPRIQLRVVGDVVGIQNITKAVKEVERVSCVIWFAEQ